MTKMEHKRSITEYLLSRNGIKGRIEMMRPIFTDRKGVLCTIKGTRINYVSLIFYYYECVKFDSNCPYMTQHVDPNSPYFLTPLLTPIISV